MSHRAGGESGLVQQGEAGREIEHDSLAWIGVGDEPIRDLPLPREERCDAVVDPATDSVAHGWIGARCRKVAGRVELAICPVTACNALPRLQRSNLVFHQGPGPVVPAV